MIKFHIQITAIEPLTEEELEKRKTFKERDFTTLSYRDYNGNDWPSDLYKQVRVINATLTDEQFEEVKKAIIGTI